VNKITVSSKVKKSAHKKHHVENIMIKWINSWSMHRERKGDLNFVRALFEKIDVKHREVFSIRDLKKYIKMEWSWIVPEELAESLLDEIGSDESGNVTWLAFAMTNNVLDLFQKLKCKKQKCHKSLIKNRIKIDSAKKRVKIVTSAVTKTTRCTSKISKKRAIANYPTSTRKILPGNSCFTSSRPPFPFSSSQPSSQSIRRRPATAEQRPARSNNRNIVKPTTAVSNRCMHSNIKKFRNLLEMRDRLEYSPFKKSSDVGVDGYCDTASQERHSYKVNSSRSSKSFRSSRLSRSSGSSTVSGSFRVSRSSRVSKSSNVKRIKRKENQYVGTKDLQWVKNISKDWIEWLKTSNSIDIVLHLKNIPGGVNTIIDRVLRRTALHYACETGDVLLTKELCMHKRTLCQIEDTRGDTPLDIALKNRHMVVANIILNKMINNNILKGRRKLHAAANVVHINK
jgi:hypothetical protein